MIRGRAPRRVPMKMAIKRTERVSANLISNCTMPYSGGLGGARGDGGILSHSNLYESGRLEGMRGVTGRKSERRAGLLRVLEVLSVMLGAKRMRIWLRKGSVGDGHTGRAPARCWTDSCGVRSQIRRCHRCVESSF